VTPPEVLPSASPTVGVRPSEPTAQTRRWPPHFVEYLGCGPEGEGPETALNYAKNRDDDAPQEVPEVQVKAWVGRAPGDFPKHRAKWTGESAWTAQTIATSEGLPVILVGILLSATDEGPEECNCKSHPHPKMFDTHVNLVAHAGDGRELSVIVKVTPRLRRRHESWNETILAAHTGERVRVTGWITFDNEHKDMITKGLRSTVWEVHPVTRFQVEDGHGGWADL
jgi:hypothetical protein